MITTLEVASTVMMAVTSCTYYALQCLVLYHYSVWRYRVCYHVTTLLVTMLLHCLLPCYYSVGHCTVCYLDCCCSGEAQQPGKGSSRGVQAGVGGE